MSADDITAIRQTLAAYNVAGDRLRIEALAATFDEDGVLVTPTGTLVGRKQIMAGLAPSPQARDDGAAARLPTFVRHHLTTSHLTLTSPETAEGRSYFIVFTDIGLDHAGHYVDRLRKCEGAWLFARREARVDWVNEASLFPDIKRVRETRTRVQPARNT